MTEQEVKDLIAAITNADSVEIVNVPPGSTIEAEIAKRNMMTPPGDSASCDDSDWLGNHVDKDEWTVRREKALVGVRTKQARTLKVYDLLKELEKSISTPKEERTSFTLLQEVLLFSEIRQLAERI